MLRPRSPSLRGFPLNARGARGSYLMENKGSRGEGEAEPRAAPLGSPQPRVGARARRTPRWKGARGRSAQGHRPRLPRRPQEPSLRAPAAMLHSRRAPII